MLETKTVTNGPIPKYAQSVCDDTLDFIQVPGYPSAIRVFTLTHSRRNVVQREPWLTCLTHEPPNSFALAGRPVRLAGSQSARFSLGEEIYPMNSKITQAQLSSDVLYPWAKSKALSRIITFGASIAAFVNVRGAQTVR